MSSGPNVGKNNVIIYHHLSQWDLLEGQEAALVNNWPCYKLKLV